MTKLQNIDDVRDGQANLSGRYICYVEDEPMVWTKALHDREFAIQAARYLVAENFANKGAGEGMVLDTVTDAIIAVWEGTRVETERGSIDVAIAKSLPQDAEMLRAVQTVRGWHEGRITHF